MEIIKESIFILNDQLAFGVAMQDARRLQILTNHLRALVVPHARKRRCIRQKQGQMLSQIPCQFGAERQGVLFSVFGVRGGNHDRWLVRIEIANHNADRLQIVFDEKPNDEQRALLKKAAFKWSPRFGAWQRQLTRTAVYAAKNVLGSSASA